MRGVSNGPSQQHDWKMILNLTYLHFVRTSFPQMPIQLPRVALYSHSHMEEVIIYGAVDSVTSTNGPKIIPEIVARWNCSTDRGDEMTWYLCNMNFWFSKGTPKQQLVMREFKKITIHVGFLLKHGFPTKPAPDSRGYAAIQWHQKHLQVSIKDVYFSLCHHISWWTLFKELYLDCHLGKSDTWNWMMTYLLGKLHQGIAIG